MLSFWSACQWFELSFLKTAVTKIHWKIIILKKFEVIFMTKIKNDGQKKRFVTDWPYLLLKIICYCRMMFI